MICSTANSVKQRNNKRSIFVLSQVYRFVTNNSGFLDWMTGITAAVTHNKLLPKTGSILDYDRLLFTA
jgi:hypothetical protein